MADVVNQKKHQVVVIGGGFGGLETVRRLKRVDVDITLIDRRNFHLFQPLLYQVATGGLSPANIAAPLRSILSRQRNCQILMEEVVGFDVDNREVILSHGRCKFDTLVLAAGAVPSYFNHDEWKAHAPALKSIENATAIRAQVYSSFERAERESDLEVRKELLTFVVVGAGPTGVELAGALAEISRHTLKNEFRNINPRDARIVLIEAGKQVLPAYSKELTDKAARKIVSLGIEMKINTKVMDVTDRFVECENNGQQVRIPARTVMWAAGVKANRLGNAIAEATDCETDRTGRAIVTSRLNLPEHDNVFVIGDLAHCDDLNGDPLPGVAPVAIQQGRYVAKIIKGRIRDSEVSDAFRYKDRGSMATIGRKAAIAEIGKFKFSGLFAWLLWLVIHLMQIVQFQNRLLVMIQWSYNYFTYNRAARLITQPRSDEGSDQSK